MRRSSAIALVVLGLAGRAAAEPPAPPVPRVLNVPSAHLQGAGRLFPTAGGPLVTERDPFAVWTAYFERLTQAARSGLFQIIGHADLAKKFCFYPTQDCNPLFRTFLEAACQSDTAIELNTAGLRKECKEIYPSRRILDLAREPVPRLGG